MIQYKLKQTEHKFGTQTLLLETLENLDETIDQLCAEYAKSGDNEAQRKLAEEMCPYFGVVWPAATALTRHISQMGTWLKNKSILEVGCGLALPSIMASKLGAKVLAIDYHPDVPKFLKKNLALNKSTITYQNVNWKTSATERLGQFDFVIGSDILYEKNHPLEVAKTLTLNCSSKGHILLADPGRPYLQSAVDEIIHAGFHIEMLTQNEIFMIVCQKV